MYGHKKYSLNIKPYKKERDCIIHQRYNLFLILGKCYFFDSSKEAFLNSFNTFSNSKDALRARVPAALLPFSICCSASATNAAFNS